MPDDAASWEELGKTTPQTECREGYVVVHRFHAQDYVCVTISAAEMWVRHGMGEISGNATGTNAINPVNPLTRCDAGFIAVFVIDAQKYSCIMEETAQEWIEQEIAEIHDPESYIMEKISYKETQQKIHDINQQIKEFKVKLQDKQAEMKKSYDRKYAEALEESKAEEKKATKDYNERPGMTKEEISKKIILIRDQYESAKDDLLQEKQQELERLEDEYENKIKSIIDSYQFDPDIKIVWNSAKSSYEASSQN